jgi:hypothetical protein
MVRIIEEGEENRGRRGKIGGIVRYNSKNEEEE